MALWQYVFSLIPQNQKNDKSFFDNEGNFDPGLFWIERKEKVEIFDEVEIVIPLSKSWCENIIQFGDLESNCMEIYTGDHGYIESASFRIDFRTDYMNIVKRIIRICKSREILILDELFNIIPFDIDEFYRIIENSPQKRKYIGFLKNNYE